MRASHDCMASEKLEIFAGEGGHDSSTSSYSVLCDCCCISFCLPGSSPPEASGG